MLTVKQRDLLLFINKYIGDHGTSPSFEEMKDALGLKSKSGIHRLLNALVERGFIERLENKARALEVKRLPDEAGHQKSETSSATSMKEQPVQNSNGDTVDLPLYGKIAAGTPIEALRNEQEMVSVPAGIIGNQECYALTIEGDSMMKAGIMDGDTVVIEKCTQARDGEIIVALVDDEEVTLKRLRREIGSVILQPENDSYTSIALTPDRVQIQGKLRGLYRYY